MLKAIPQTHQVIMPYLIVENAAGFIEFMQQVFNAKETHRHMRDENAIMHAELAIYNCTIMCADSTEKYAPRTSGMFIYVDDVDATYNLALEKGAKSIMAPAEQSYGRSCGVTDAFGNTWWITSPPKL